jgi:hypothetical protein
MSKSLNVATESLQFISDKYDELIKRMEESERQRTLIMKENSVLKAELTKASTEITALHHMVNEQEQYMAEETVWSSEVYQRVIPILQSRPMKL